MLKWISRLSNHLGDAGIIGTGAAVIGAGIIGAGASIAAGEQASSAAESASKRAGGIAEAGRAEEQRRFDQLLPFRQAAMKALAKISGGFNIEDSPFFKFRQKKETDALRKQLSAAGNLRGGRGLRAISELTRDLSAEETERQFGREFNIAQLGVSAGFPQGGVDTGPGVTAALARGSAGDARTSAIQAEAAGIGPLIAELLKLRGQGGGRPSLFSRGTIDAGISNIGNLA